MMTIVTHVHLKEGVARDWEAAMRTRLSAAKKRPGWVGGQLLRPADKPDRRVIVGTWRTRADWEAWHRDPKFAETVGFSRLQARKQAGDEAEKPAKALRVTSPTSVAAAGGSGH